jgi:hypothetical protein
MAGNGVWYLKPVTLSWERRRLAGIQIRAGETPALPECYCRLPTADTRLLLKSLIAAIERIILVLCLWMTRSNYERVRRKLS